MRLKNKQKKKIIRRSVSLAVALAMLLNETYIWSIIDDIPFFETNENRSQITAYAAEDSGDDPEFQHDDETTKAITIPLEDFKEYSDACQIYSTYHQYDKITIYSTGTSDLFESGFSGLGTVNKPFAGSIAISANTDITLNLDAPLFNYVYDSVTINNNTALHISRYYLVNGDADETTPIIAKYVYHDSGNSDLVTWNIDLTTPSDSTDHYLSQFGGFIGTMDDDKGMPKLALNVTMNTVSMTKDDATKTDNGAVAIVGSGDLGLACGHMDAGAELTFTYTADRALSKIETSGGDVGGLVGEMEDGAVFTLKNENAVTSGIDIITSAGSSYAGGLVGKNVGGTVVVKDSSDATAVYPVTQHITGTSGAGGVYGYYQPVEALISATVHNDETGEDETVDKSFDTSKFNINCQVNGSGYTGGLFGALDTAYNVTINGSGTVTVNHNSGNCTGYGGLIGQYKADSVERTLSISSVTAQSSKAGTATYYGGGIGVIEPTTPTYVEFSSFTSNASNAGSLTFGGLVASADKAFVKSTASTITASGYKGGGFVGSLKDGVLQISGANTITGSSADPGDKEDLKVGRFVGYRDNGLVFMDAGASCTCGAADVDDIGSWGGLIKLGGFTTPANVLSVSGHAVTIGASGYAFTPIKNADDFAVTALRFQIDGSESQTGNPFVTFANTTETSSTIASTGISMSGDVTLTGTGIYGLTRDNDIGSDMAKCVYNNTFSGGSKTVTFDTGTIYRHKHNGLFAKLNGGTVQNVTFAGNITVNAKTDMYVGAAAAQATGNFTASSITVNTAMPYSGSGTLYIGGILGEAEGGTDSSIGTINVTGCTVKANITGSNSSAVLGGVIGQISHKADENRTWTFTTVNVSGTISNESSGKMGGLVAVINGGYNGNSNHRVLTLNGVTIDGLTASGSDADSMGGLLGYSWLKTDTNVTSVTVQNNSSDSSKKPTVSNGAVGGIGGMIYRATGKWTVTSLDIKNIVVSGTGSFGMIVNKGISHDDAKFYTEGSRSAIYLCLPSGYTYNITSSTLPDTLPVFDELCAYTAPDAASVLKNGNGVISINTTFKTDGSTASGSYHARTAKGATANPNSRYYYNLDTVTANSSSNAILTYNESTNSNAYKNQLMSWGLNQYACTNLKQYFADVFGNSIPNETYDLENYSWYPVDLDKNITVNGTFKFYSHEFELSEDAKKTAETANEYDRTNLENNQHYTMHCGLFRNVASGKTLTNGTTVFEGDVGLLGTGDNTNSGALICGTVQGASNTSKATVQVSDTGSISLNGVYVYGVTTGNSPNYAPLLINKVGSYVNLTVKNVTSTGYLMATYSTNSPYMSKDSSNYPKAASSLIGNVGLSDSPTGINVNFSNIKLDGRKTAVASPYDSQLTGVYGSDLTIFTRSTLLNQFKYATGSTGTYNYTSDEDWSSGSHAGHGVTYGKEVGYTSSDTDTEYPGKEQKYSGTSGYYTSPDTPAAGTAYSGFKTGFIPYVYVPYNSTNKTHQLRVNHEASTATGCGTYNDPYILSDGYKLEAFSYWINTGFTNNDSLLIPSDTNHLTISNGAITAINGTWCTDKTAHATFTYSSATEKFTGTISSTNYTIDPDVMQTYLAGAYYKIPDEVSEITIPTTGENHKYDFEGLGNTSANSAAFRGVIDGNGKTLINNTTYPLIERSNGSVVKDLTIEVKPTSAISLTGTQYTFNTAVEGETANAAYGAVIAKVFGGDNIIDNVSLAFGTSSTNKVNISLGGTAQLVPVGGYVGVIVNGGLYFRNMKRIDENNNEILYDESLFNYVSFSATANSATDTEPMSDSNKEWLYVNPIVGRVINGFAVSESNAYRPYEDGSRTYKGGTEDEVRYWDEANQTELTTAPTSLSHVTMQNGNKHYSIADISSALDKLTTGTTPVGVPNGQALFVMATIVNSGMSKQSLGYSDSAVGANGNYYVSRGSAEYNYVGKIPGSTEANYATAIADYNKAATDGTAIRGYLMTEYTTGETNIAGTDVTVKLTTSGGKYYMPDGFKGIGNMYNHDNAATTNVDENDYYRMKITNFDGNGATVSMNSSWYFYYSDPGSNSALTKFDTAYTHYSMVGFGLFNYQTGKTDKADATDQSNRYYNFILTGNVVADCINSNSADGTHITYIGGLKNNNWTGKYDDGDPEYADSNYMPAVGSLIGYATNTTYTDSVALQNIYVKGLRNTGGLIGMTSLTTFTSDTSDPKFTYENTKSTPSNKIKVHGAATTGGMIGKNQQSIVYIDNGNATYSLTEVKSECTTVNNNQQNYGVGGFVGMCRAADSSKVNRSITVKNITVGSKTQDTPSEISATADKISVGGVVGTITRAKVSIEDCSVYNQSIKSGYSSGGMIGYWATPTDGSNITNVTIYAKDYGSAEKNPVITSSKSDGAAGGFIGNRLNENAGVSVYIRNSNVYGYTIGGTKLANAGGAIGIWNGGTVNLQNVDISSCNIIAKSGGGNAGGIAGSQQSNVKTNENNIYGYNILLKNLSFAGQNKGYILGYNTSTNQTIKLSGFSRQNDKATITMISALVGKTYNQTTPSYGTGGYVIFADYTDEASTVQNKKFANMVMSDKDIAEYEVIGSRTTITDYKVIAKKDASGNSVVQSYSYNTRSNTFSDTVSPESVSASGTKTSYETIDASTNLTQVTSVSELTPTKETGFYIVNNCSGGDYGKYLTSNLTTGNNNTKLKADASSTENAALWYFELVDSSTNKYKIYTYVDGVKKYLSHRVGKAMNINIYSATEAQEALDTQAASQWGADAGGWDYEVIISTSNQLINGFTIELINNNNSAYKYFRYYTNGFVFSNSTGSNNANVLTIYKMTTTDASYNLVTENYSSSAFAPVQGEAITGTLTNKTDATATQAEAYVEDLGELDNSDHSYEVYTVTVTAVKNVYGYTDNSKPYVTTNPKRFITDDSQFLTGDGVLSALYVSSAFKKITDDRADSVNKPKAYTTYSLERYSGENTDEEALARIRTELSNSSTEFKNYSGYESSGIKNFPLLVAEDTNKETLTPLINNYLRTLTNTNYNFADTTNTAIYDVGLYRCVFNESTKDFDVYTSDVCLKKTYVTTTDGTSYYFYMEAKEVDTQDLPQFTLMDVQFKDPSGSGKIAYHLYVPVYVKKVLRYDFNAEIKSGTDYYWTAYTKLGKTMTRQGLFENLGNPVTIAFEYEYDRIGTDWKDAANGGDSLLTNYYKSLTLKNHNNNGWASGTKMVLVDANNSDKYYYLDSPPTDTPTTISLYDFTDESGQHYSPVPFQDLMTVTVSQDDNGTLTPTTGNTAVGATVLYNNTYYRPITDSDTGLDNEDKFSVTEVTNIQKEKYYLSIFTKADSSNTNIYRYEISSPESFGSTGSGVMTSGTWTVNDWRSNRIDKNTVINLFTGKLYENNLTLNVTPRSSGTPEMSATNNYLTVDMKATVSLTSSAVSSGVGVNMLTFQSNADIYQTFLMMYDKLATVGGTHEIGIDTDANAKVGINSYYYTGGNISAALTSSNATAVANPQNKKVELAKYIELGNEQNLISLIGSSSNSYAATLQVNFDMVYAADDLSTQFPKRDTSVPEQSVIGANVIGYSKISSTAEGAANSATYDKETDLELYYTTSESTATLKYNVEETPNNAAGRYSYLGINSVETGDDEVFVDTYAVYDTHRLTNAGNYIEFTLTLSNKGEGYVTPIVGNPTPTGIGIPLTISDYITDLKIYGADGDDADSDDDVIFEQSAATVSNETRVTTKGNNLYTVRVQKDLLKTQADGIYVIPITFKVKTGNAKFKSSGLEYSNYKVSLTAATYSTISSTDYSKTSYAFDHIIYTNARVLTSVVN